MRRYGWPAPPLAIGSRVRVSAAIMATFTRPQLQRYQGKIGTVIGLQGADEWIRVEWPDFTDKWSDPTYLDVVA